MWPNQPWATFPSDYIVTPIIPNFDEDILTLTHLPNDEGNIPENDRTHPPPSKKSEAQGLLPNGSSLSEAEEAGQNQGSLL